MATETFIRPPRFSSEREEAEWWDAHPEFILQEFETAEAEGRITRGIIQQRAQTRAAARSGEPITVDTSDIQLAGRLADRKGMERETFLRELIHSALLQQEHKLDDTSGG